MTTNDNPMPDLPRIPRQPDPAPILPRHPGAHPTDEQIAAAGRRLDRYPDPERATNSALGEMEGLAWALAIYLDVRPTLRAAHPDLVTAVQRMLAVARAFDDRHGLAATMRRGRSTEQALGDEVEAWLSARRPPVPPVIPGDDDRPGWW